MSQPVSRRLFLLLTSGAVVAPSMLLAESEGPSLLDHILLGSADLQGGIAFVEQRTGVRATFGGVHPGRGTQNALLSLGEHRYLEIIAPDPQQSLADEHATRLGKLTEPRLIGWAAHPGDLQAPAPALPKTGTATQH